MYTSLNESFTEPMNGKLLVVGIVTFFIVFFVYESLLMRGLPH
ncbi:putative membrane protein [Synechococcus sp. A15-28]|nr:putative membrane protein [Synechococcus sp. A15-28]